MNLGHINYNPALIGFHFSRAEIVKIDLTHYIIHLYIKYSMLNHCYMASPKK